MECDKCGAQMIEKTFKDERKTLTQTVVVHIWRCTTEGCGGMKSWDEPAS